MGCSSSQGARLPEAESISPPGLDPESPTVEIDVIQKTTSTSSVQSERAKKNKTPLLRSMSVDPDRPDQDWASDDDSKTPKAPTDVEIGPSGGYIAEDGLEIALEVEFSGVREDFLQKRGRQLSGSRGKFDSVFVKLLHERYNEALVYMIGSEDDLGMTANTEKHIEKFCDSGAQLVGTGHCCKKGFKDIPNQDAWSILRVEGDFSVYGVYDGHGALGHEVSSFVKDKLVPKIVGDDSFRKNGMDKLLSTSFWQMQDAVRTHSSSAASSGTTVSLAFHDHIENRITIGHVADSAIAIGKYTDTSHTNLIGYQVTTDHKPGLAEEKARIEANGGRVMFDGFHNYRVYAKKGHYPGLNMSRSVGDCRGHAHAGITCEPEVTIVDLSPEDHILLVCSDGVWEVFDAQEAVDIVAEYGPDRAMEAAQRLVKDTWELWIRESSKEPDGPTCDDITVIVVYLNHCDRKKLPA